MKYIKRKGHNRYFAIKDDEVDYGIRQEAICVDFVGGGVEIHFSNTCGPFKGREYEEISEETFVQKYNKAISKLDSLV